MYSSTILARAGYLVDERILTNSQKAKIKKDLTATPKLDAKYRQPNDPDPSFEYFSIDNGYYILPRFYGLRTFGIPKLVHMQPSKEVLHHLEFKGSLRPYQVDVIDAVKEAFSYLPSDPVNNLKSYGGGILCRPPGEGKTTMSAYIITDVIKRPTLIVVQREFLLNQWVERLKFFTNARVGIIQAQTIDVKDKDVVICMLQSLCSKDYPAGLFERYELTVYDECHHLGAKVFSRVLNKLQTPFVLGLSATPERNDGLENVFYDYLGPFLSRAAPPPNKDIIVHSYLYETEDTKERKKFKEVVNFRTKHIMLPTMVTNLSLITSRNKLIVDLTNRLLEEAPSRQVLVLTARIEHAQELMLAFGLDRAGMYVGGMPEKELKKTEEKTIVVGSYAMAREALDIPNLNTLVLATPLEGNIVQTVGRIMRRKDHVTPPLIIDIIDNLNNLYYKARARITYYVENEYKITYYKAIYKNGSMHIGQEDKPYIYAFRSKPKENENRLTLDN